MSDNLEIGRLETNLGIAAVNIFDTAMARLDGRHTAPLPIDVGDDNAASVSQNDLRFISHIVLSPGSPAATAASIITIDPIDTDQSPPAARDMGGYFIINKSGFAATIQIAGQTNTAPVIAAAGGGIIHVTSTGIWGHDVSVSAADVSFDDPIAGSPLLDNVYEALAYLLGNPFGGGGGGGGAVDSVFGRTGAVVATDGDYSAAKISYVDPIAGSPELDNVQEALDYALNNLGGGGGGGGSAFSGALVTKAADQIGANYTTLTSVTWNSETFDTDNRHDNSTNPDRITFGAADVGKNALAVSVMRAQNVATSGTEYMRTLLIWWSSASAAKGSVTAMAFAPAAGPIAGIAVVNSQLLFGPIVEGDYIATSMQMSSDTSVDVMGVGVSSMGVIVFG